MAAVRGLALSAYIDKEGKLLRARIKHFSIDNKVNSTSH